MIKIQCPAKINLGLKVLKKRDDGFHDIESIMQAISLFDYITIFAEPWENTEIVLSGSSSEIPYDEQNLVYKAAELFMQTMQPHSINIHIEKNIPVSAGLAGGSADAAGTLYGLNEFFSNPLSQEELHELCSQLGSDLNFCLEGGRQLAQGRGEILTPLEFEEFFVTLIKPLDLRISAKEAYEKWALKYYPPLAGGSKSLISGWGIAEHKNDKISIQYSKDLRNNMTDAENKLWAYLRKSQLCGIKFRRQQTIGHYIADFVSFEKRLIIELDGGQHNEDKALIYDSKRDEFLKEQGYTVLRFWNSDIFENLECVLEQIKSYIDPTPKFAGQILTLPQGEGSFANDLEKAIIDDYPQLRKIKSLHPDAVMSGSGPTYFVLNKTLAPIEGCWVKNNLKAIPYGVKKAP